MEEQLLFALDIGTRSVMGLVGRKNAAGIELVAFDREEHHTRAMMDGQIHDVREVADILGQVKERLEAKVGPLNRVAIAAAGRALKTVRATASLDMSNRGALTEADERALELVAIQEAQRMLAVSSEGPLSGSDYCVGYSVVKFTLDDSQLKSLVGQRGKNACIELIATFLPRQVIDSLQSALEMAGLEMDTLTLEPIAAINVLIPPTMRHLNLALVDVGAGTSDVAITSSGSVNGYGMVPCAGDEITETISQKYLLDFNVAENIKRELTTKNTKLSFTDVLGMTQKVSSQDILSNIQPHVNELAQLIAKEILNLNTASPQAVLLVGGGSLTPLLPEALAQALAMPPERVGIRKPDAVSGISRLPEEMQSPDSVTPLGILRLAGSQTLNFMNVTVNDQSLRLFNLGTLTVGDALLSAGVDTRSLYGRPGMGITIQINGNTSFLSGTMGQPGRILLNGEEATFDRELKEGDVLEVSKGQDGSAPNPTIADVIELPEPLLVWINGQSRELPPLLLLNDQPVDLSVSLKDRDSLVYKRPATLGEVLSAAQVDHATRRTTYIVNGIERDMVTAAAFTINDKPAAMNDLVNENDSVRSVPFQMPTVAQVLGMEADEPDKQYIAVTFNERSCVVPFSRHIITMNGQTVSRDTLAESGSVIEYHAASAAVQISDVLLAAEFSLPRTATGPLVIQVNGQEAQFLSPVKEGDRVTVRMGEKAFGDEE